MKMRHTNKVCSAFKTFKAILVTFSLLLLILLIYFSKSVSIIAKFNFKKSFYEINSKSNIRILQQTNILESEKKPSFGEVLSWDQVDHFTLDEFDHYLNEVNKSSFYLTKPKNVLPLQTKGLIILTNYRSGSSFLGQLFNQHQDLFYIYEPLLPLTSGCKSHVQTKIKLLHRLLKCDFPPVIDLFKQNNITPEDTRVSRLCLRNNFCFRDKTMELESAALCQSLPIKKCLKMPIHLPLAMNLCRKKKMTVVKSLRLCRIQEMESILTDPNLDVKIIHLLRDPRGMESSRLKIHSDWPYLERAKQTCTRILRNGLFGKANSIKPNWLQGRYKAVRYEDLSTKPVQVAQSIYEFAGIEFTAAVRKWIKSNTKPSSSNQEKDPFSTTRNSSSTMQAWRSHLTLEQVLNIQNACSEAMTFFGYKPVTTQEELNDKTTNLF